MSYPGKGRIWQMQRAKASKANNAEYDTAICMVCGLIFRYHKGLNKNYIPETCQSFDCIHKYLHKED